MNSLKKYNDKMLINLINDGYENAFEFVFKEYYEMLCSYLTYLKFDSGVAEQIVQDVFINIWESRNSFSPKGNIKSYLFKAVKNKSINIIKHEAVRLKSQDDITRLYYSDEQNIEKQFEQEEFLKFVEEGINELPEKCREVFLLVKFSELSYKEAAAVLNISQKTVENHMGKALRVLREFLLPSLK